MDQWLNGREISGNICPSRDPVGTQWEPSRYRKPLCTGTRKLPTESGGGGYLPSLTGSTPQHSQSHSTHTMLRLEGLANCKQTAFSLLPYLQTFRERRILDNTFCQIHAHICKQNLASGEEIMANLKSGQDTDNVDRLTHGFLQMGPFQGSWLTRSKIRVL